MDIIINNPFRILGLFANAKTALVNRNFNKLKMYVDADQEIPDDLSLAAFPCLGPLKRAKDNIEYASSHLNLGQDKMLAALFWFYEGNPITDEPAFDELRESNIQGASDIWKKLVEKGEVNERNFSAFQNISTLYLLRAFGKTVVDNSLLYAGIGLKIQFLESDFALKYKADITDTTYKISKDDLQLLFLHEIEREIQKNKKCKESDFIDLLGNIDFTAKPEFLKGFVQKPIEQIEKLIEDAKNRHKANKANAVNIGKILYDKTSEKLKQLKSLLGESNVKYSSITDKVAGEILQCSIDSFNHFQEIESDTDYFEKSLQLAKLAESIAVGKLTKDRIQDSIVTLEEMKDREILQVIEVLQSIKNSYEENKRKIKLQVKLIEETDIEIILGRKSINQKIVDDNIKNSLDWQKVNELIANVLTDNNLKKIKENNDTKVKTEFFELANWLRENSQKSLPIDKIINKYKAIPPKLPFKIISSVITNTDKDNNPLPVTNPLYKKHTRFVGLKFNVECFENKNVTFYKKYIKTDGSYSSNDKISPKGYTNSTTVSINTITKVINLSGWGSNTTCTYSVGKHRIEVYVDEYMIYSKEFVVDLAPSEMLEIELKKAEDKLTEIKTTQYFKMELEILNSQMNKIKEWQFLRSDSDKERQINEQEKKIYDIVIRASNEKASQSSKQQSIINIIKSKIQQTEY